MHQEKFMFIILTTKKYTFCFWYDIKLSYKLQVAHKISKALLITIKNSCMI